MSEKLLIMLTTGTEDRGSRATLAFSMGVASLISGVDTCMFMTMGGTVWARPTSAGKVHIGGFDPLQEIVEQYVGLGGRILVCSPCDDFYCSMAKDAPLIEGAELSGLTHVVDIALSSTVVTL